MSSVAVSPAIYPFSPLKGTERLPGGSLLNPPPAPPPGGRLGDRDDGCRRTRSCRGDTGGSSVVQIRPAASTFLWSWSTQQTPW
jgi:hypothetical protein